MKKRNFGGTGLQVSEIGFGAWGIGGAVGGSVSYGETDDHESCFALQSAFDMGVTFFDTADFYGHGHSEKLIGNTLGNVREKIILSTKVGLLGDGSRQDFSPQHLRDSLEESLRRLRTDYVDIYQLHNPSIDSLKKNDDTIRVLHDFVDEGKVRVFGISLRTPDDGIAAVKELGFQCIQLNFNLVDQRALVSGLMDFCADQGIGVIIRTPLCFGFLTGGYSSETKFDSQDHRSRWPQDQLKKWAYAPLLFEQLSQMTTGQTHAQFALRFCLSFPAVSTVIPGMLNRQHVRENVEASHFGPLSNDELESIRNIYAENTFFVAHR